LSPIFTRPYREQHEHDRIIRQLQARYKRKHEVVINPGHEQHGSVTVGELAVYPDLLLYSQAPTHHLEATVEVETSESVHLLEARAEWGVFSQVPVPFVLYVPISMLDTARRIIDEQQWLVAEIWTYLPGMDQLRFVQVFKHPQPPVVVPPKGAARAKATSPSKTAPGSAAKPPAASAHAPASAKAAAKPSGKPTAKAAGKVSAKPMPAPAPKAASKAAPKATRNAVAPGAAKAAAKGVAAGKKPAAPRKSSSPPARKPARASAAGRSVQPKASAVKAKPVARRTPALSKASSGRGTPAQKKPTSGKAARRR
jgi:hypothetical protein